MRLGGFRWRAEMDTFREYWRNYGTVGKGPSVPAPVPCGQAGILRDIRGRRFPLSQSRQIGLFAIVAIVLLRISIGCHFLYEGVWKIENAETFSADPYLSEAKGLAAPLFYAMLDDFYGRDRLVVSYPASADGSPSDAKDGAKMIAQSDRAVIESPRTVAAWKKYGEMLKNRIGPVPESAAIQYDKARLAEESKTLAEESKSLAEEQKTLTPTDPSAKSTNPTRLAQVKRRISQIAGRTALINETNSLVAEKEKSDGARSDITGNAGLSLIAKQLQIQTLDRRLAWIDTRLDWLSRQQPVADIQKLVAEGKADDAQKAQAIVMARRQWVDEHIVGYESVLDDYLNSNSVEIAAHFQSLDRYQASLRGAPGTFGTDFEKKRTWDEKGTLVAETAPWLKQLDTFTKSLKQTSFDEMKLWDAETKQAVEGGLLKRGAVRTLLSDSEIMKGKMTLDGWWNPLTWSRTDQMSFLVTWMLTLIGLALIVGCCTRLAALGGAVFMAMIVLTQFSWPAWYPPNPGIVGHALVIDKNFVEMMALLVLAGIGAGRWGGVDSVIWKLWKMLPCNRPKVSETKA